MTYLIRHGRLTWVAELLLGSLVLLGGFGIPFFQIPLLLAIPLGAVSIVAGAVLMFEGRATALGLKPFTNDPLGWRKAKESYKADAVSEETKKGDQS